MRILIIEDNFATREILTNHLEDFFDIIECENGKKGLQVAKEKKPEIIILDINLPDISGMDICKRIREDIANFGEPKILMLTGNTKQDSVVKGLKIGADDYIKKPFDIEEVILRIKNIAKSIPSKERFEYKNILVDNIEKTVYEDGLEIKKISKLQYELLVYLIINKGIYISKEKIYENVWGDFLEGETRAVDQCIKKLRSKLITIKENLNSKPGFGYKLKKS